MFTGIKSIFNFNTWANFAKQPRKYTGSRVFIVSKFHFKWKWRRQRKKNTEQNKKTTNNARSREMAKYMNCTLLTQQIHLFLFLYFNVCCPFLPVEFTEHFQRVCVCVCVLYFAFIFCHFCFTISFVLSLSLISCQLLWHWWNAAQAMECKFFRFQILCSTLVEKWMNYSNNNRKKHHITSSNNNKKFAYFFPPNQQIYAESWVGSARERGMY